MPERARCRAPLAALLGAALIAATAAAPAVAADPVLRVAPLPRSPNPAVTPQVTWSTGNGSPGEVTVVRADGSELLFASGPSGTAPAPWIRHGQPYRFRLYAAGTERRLLTVLRIRGAGSTRADVAPPQAPRATSGTTNAILRLVPLAALAGLLALVALHVRSLRRAG